MLIFNTPFVTLFIHEYISSSLLFRASANATSVVSWVSCDLAMLFSSGTDCTATSIRRKFYLLTDTSSLMAFKYEAKRSAVSSVMLFIELLTDKVPFSDKSQPFSFK